MKWEGRKGKEMRGEEKRMGKVMKRKGKGEMKWNLVSKFFQLLYTLHQAFKNVIWSAHTYLILPWDGNTACSKFGVEVIVSLVQIYSLDCGELLYVQNILTVHCPRLGEGNDHRKGKTGDKFILADYLSSWNFTCCSWKSKFFSVVAILGRFGLRELLKKKKSFRTCSRSRINYSHRAQREAPLFQPPASWSWCFWRTSGPWRPLLHPPGTPASAWGLWSAAVWAAAEMNHHIIHQSIHPSTQTRFPSMLTILQMALVSSVNLSLYSSSSSCTLRSTSSRFTRSLRARKGDRPAVIS